MTNDSLTEDAESFDLTFEDAQFGDVGLSDHECASVYEIEVTIIDDDPPVQMEYSLVEAGPFEEDAGTVQVEVVAVTNEAGVPNTEYAVGVQSEDITANWPVDYAEVDETLNFSLGDFAAFVNDVGDTRYRQTVSFDVVIVDNRFDEGTETFRLKLSESPGYEGSVFGVPEIEVTINDNDTAGVTVTRTELMIEEGNSDTYEVVLDTQPSSDVTVTINDPANPEITAEPASWTFTPDNWDEPRTVTVTADHDSDRIDEAAATITHTVTSTFDQYNDLSADSVTVTVTDDDVLSVAVSFEHSSYEVAESDDAFTVDEKENEATVKVTLSDDPERTVDIPLILTNQGGASDADYSGVPTSVIFNSGEMSKSFTFTAADDGEDDDGESVKLTFGTPPEGVNAGSVPETIVTITDDDLPASVTVSFSSPTYPVTEGGGVEVTVNLSEDPERKIVIPIGRENLGGATDSDYRGVPPSVTFNAKDISESFTFEAVADNLEDIGESVKLGFDGTLPDGVSAGSTSEATVSIANGIAQNSLVLNFKFSEYTLPEGATTMVTVTLNAAPGSEVTIPLVTTGQGETSDADYSGVPASVVFDSGDIEKSFPFTAEADDVDDDGDSVKLTFGTLPGGVSAGNISVAIVNITDDDTAGVNISETSLEIEEGDSDTYDVALDTEPTGDVTVTIEGITGTDLILDKASLTFTDQNWDALQRVTVTADQDDDAADEAEVTLTHTANSPDDYYAGLKAADVTVRVTDDDPAVEVSFDSATYSATEGGANAVVMVQLSSPAPHRVEIPITAEGSGGAGTDDWSGVPQTVTFDTGDTSESFSVIAFDDTAEDDGEMVELGFGILPEGFVKGSPHTAKVALMNDDRSEDSTASCDSPVWTASLQLGDQTTADWGQFKLVHQLFHPGPPSSLSVDEFEYQDENFVIMSINLVPMVPTGTAARSGPFATPEFASFSIDIDRGEWDGPVSDAQWSGPLRGILKRHFRDWTLYVDDVAFPFADALFTAGVIEWQGTEFNDMFNNWSLATEYQLCIDDTPVSAPTSPTPPSMPKYLRLFPAGGPLFAYWREPFSNGGSEITRYEVQVKERGDDWANASDVLEYSVQPTSNRLIVSYTVSDLTNGVDYVVRVRAVNAVGESPYSGETWVTQQEDTPLLEEAVVDGALLSLDFDRQLDGTSVPAPDDFWVLVHEESHVPDSVMVTGRKVILTLPDPVTHVDEVDFIYILPDDLNAPRIRDRDGNYYTTPYLEYDQARNETAVVSLLPVTVSMVELPDSHNGSDSFTFTIGFSESVNVRAEYGAWMVEVSGGSVTRAQNLDRRTEEWEFTVAPDPNADVEINVPAGRPCEDAVYHPCGNGNRPLSNGLQLTVPFLQTQSQRGNSLATGGPVITGTPRVGETLTADTSGIEDEDGLDNVSYSYQWIRNEWASDTDIAGETDPSYTMVSGDEGKAMKVRVTFTDDADNEESLTSVAVLASVSRSDRLPAAPGTPTVSPKDTGALTVSWKIAPDDGGPPITGYLVQWKEAADRWETAADVSEATVTGTTHTITGLTDGVEYAVRVVANSGAGNSPPSEEAFGTTRETTPPELSAAIVDGTTLTLTYSEALGEDSVPGVDTFTVMADSDERGIARASVVGATVILILDSAVVAEDAVTVSYAAPADESAPRIRDEAGNHAASFNNQAVTNNSPREKPPLPPGNLTGIANEDGSVTLTWDDPDDETITGYQILRRRPTEGEDTLLVYVEDTGSGATTYTDANVSVDIGHVYRVKAISTAGLSQWSNSVNVTPLAPQESTQNTTAIGQPTIGGTAQVGETLMADTTGIADEDGLENVSFSYQWFAGDAEISGETDASYTLVADDEGKTIKVQVSFTDDAGNYEILTSAATEVVAARPNTAATGRPTISGTVRVGEVLTADTTGIGDADGVTNVSYSYQWVVTDGGAYLDISGETGATYTLVAIDRGLYIQVRVSFTDDAGNREKLTSAVTDVVAAAS